MSSETPAQPQPQPEELSPPQVAVLARTTRTAVNQAIKSGRLPARLEHTHRGPVYLIRKSDAEAYAATVRPWPGSRPERLKGTKGRSG